MSGDLLVVLFLLAAFLPAFLSLLKDGGSFYFLGFLFFGLNSVFLPWAVPFAWLLLFTMPSQS